jgi:hypothetical protein
VLTGASTDAKGSPPRDRWRRSNEPPEGHVDAQGHTDLNRHCPPAAEATTDLVRRLPTAADARRIVERLRIEHSTALASGLAHDPGYIKRLESELGAARDAYTGLAVTEIATVLGELFGRHAG